MTKLLFALPVIALHILIAQPLAWARPEYATTEKLNCTACHVNPWGGGPRNLTGKGYGAHQTGAPSIPKDLFYADARFVGYYPTEKVSQRSSGLALMEAAAYGNIAVRDADSTSELRGLLGYNLAPLFGSQVREAYLRWGLGGRNPAEATFLTTGRFYVPFGLLTDEHRTYTRIQTGMTFNDFTTGLALSGNLHSAFHYDAVLMSGMQTNGGFATNDLTWGEVLNLRWNPATLPILLGASGNHQRMLQAPDPYASSAYLVISLDRISGNRLRGSLQAERVDAWNWNASEANNGEINPGLTTFFAAGPASPYAQAIATSHSVGYYAKFRYDITPSLNVFYRFDLLEPSTSDFSDRFSRHGVGAELYFSTHASLNVRFEAADTDLAEANDSDVLAVQDDAFLVFRFWL